MNESKKLYTVLIGIFIIAVVAIVSVVVSNQKGDKYVEKVEKLFTSKEAKLVYLGRPTCGYCNLLKPHLDEYAEKYNFKYEYINTDEIGSTKFNQILRMFDLPTDGTFGTPYLGVVKDDRKVGEQKGYVEENELFNFLQQHGFIGENEKLALNYIDYVAYTELLEKGDKEIFVAVQTGCSHCEEAKPVLEEIAKEYDIKINVINISKFADEEEQKEFMASLPYYNENQWGTPLMLVVENKEVKANKEGFVDKEDYIQFFKDNGFIKE